MHLHALESLGTEMEAAAFLSRATVSMQSSRLEIVVSSTLIEMEDEHYLRYFH